jgi:putative glutamine amidotransferase
MLLDGLTAGNHDAGLHRIETRSGSASRSLFGREVDVYSGHHQAVRRLGRRLRIAAVSPDGVVESIEHSGRRFALGIQWHPESEHDPAGACVAEGLVAAATRRVA